METLLDAFSLDQVALLAVNWSEPQTTVMDYIRDNGLRVPVLLDNPTESIGCWLIPDDEITMTLHMQKHVGDDDDPPFPIHVVLGKDRRIRYLARSHQPGEVVDAVARAVAE